MAKLQLPPEIRNPSLIQNTNHVPLPNRHHSDSSQAELAIYIREGKKAARDLSVVLADAGRAAVGSSRDTDTTNMTSMSNTVLEKDFTVEGKKGHLGCPFSSVQAAVAADDEADGVNDVPDPTPHKSGDPICAAMFGDTTSAPAPNASSAKCPIRYLDQHSPDEIAQYLKKHSHELPRSHEVCLRRNQKDEIQIRKLDAKYGNNLIEDLSRLHTPMLPSAQPETQEAVDGASNQRVEDWAQDVSAIDADGLDDDEEATKHEDEDGDGDEERTSHFDRERPLKEVRVGESPSRPWGISVPVYDDRFNADEPHSPAAPVRMPSPEQTPKAPADKPSKCPFDHTKLRLDGTGFSEFPKMEEELLSSSPPQPEQKQGMSQQQPFTPMKQPLPPDSPPPSHQLPAFVNLAGPSKEGAPTVPQMVFNGPVFIGYPIEQAIQFMQHFQNPQR